MSGLISTIAIFSTCLSVRYHFYIMFMICLCLCLYVMYHVFLFQVAEGAGGWQDSRYRLVKFWMFLEWNKKSSIALYVLLILFAFATAHML